jgi:hypothetical protein
MRYRQTSQSGVGHIVLFIFIPVLAVIGFAGYRVYQKNYKSLPSVNSSGQAVSYDRTASRQLTNGNCQGAGSVKIGPPMKLNQIGFILPYGLVVGGHVTPVDHQYYNGLAGNNSLRDTYDVIAPADGTLISISHRGDAVNTPPHTIDKPSSDEYRLTIVHTCSFITALDLQTSLSDELKAKLPSNFDPKKGWNGSIKVKKGELLGRIGGQTLDFFVWDLSRSIKGFINPDQYTKSEAWKLYTAPVSEYLDPAIKDQVIAKYIRTVAPIDGKIDYDIDGKLIGNWFLEGTYGYAGSKDGHGMEGYWTGHLSIAPDFIDPSTFNFSIGNYGTYKGASTTDQDAGSNANSGAKQFTTMSNAPDPADVDQSSGLVKYELAQKNYALPSGQFWDSSSFATGIKARPDGPIQATVLVQLTDKRTLKLEAFPGKTAAQVSGFDNNAKVYTR